MRLRFGAFALVVVVLSLVVAVSLAGCIGCGEHYSDGDRAGYVVKFSSKGVAYKSWEGELSLSQGQTGAVEHWAFSVADDQVAKRIESALASGKKVTLHYKPWWQEPFWIDTPYDVTDVKGLE